MYDALATPEVVYPLPANDPGYVYSVAQYDHDEGNTISNGFVYAGKNAPLLRGKCLFGDIPRSKLFYAESASMQLGNQVLIYELSPANKGQKVDLEALA